LLRTRSSASDEDERFLLPILDATKASIFPRLADLRISDSIIQSLADTLRKASILHRHQVETLGGTTAEAISESQEKMRYWALQALIELASRSPADLLDTGIDVGRERLRLATLILPSVIRRFDDALSSFVEDARLRGQIPFSRWAAFFQVSG